VLSIEADDISALFLVDGALLLAAGHTPLMLLAPGKSLVCSKLGQRQHKMSDETLLIY